MWKRVLLIGSILIFLSGCSIQTNDREKLRDLEYTIVEEGSFNTIRITLKYGADKNQKVINGLKRISKPGLRVYAGAADMPKVLGGLGVAIVSTNQGVITDKEARAKNVGGEVLAFVW